MLAEDTREIRGSRHEAEAEKRTKLRSKIRDSELQVLEEGSPRKTRFPTSQIKGSVACRAKYVGILLTSYVRSFVRIVAIVT